MTGDKPPKQFKAELPGAVRLFHAGDEIDRFIRPHVRKAMGEMGLVPSSRFKVNELPLPVEGPTVNKQAVTALPTNQRFEGRVRQLLREKDLTIKAASLKLGRSHGYLNQVFSHSGRMAEDTLSGLSKLLGEDLRPLLGAEKPAKPEKPASSAPKAAAAADAAPSKGFQKIPVKLDPDLAELWNRNEARRAKRLGKSAAAESASSKVADPALDALIKDTTETLADALSEDTKAADTPAPVEAPVETPVEVPPDTPVEAPAPVETQAEVLVSETKLPAVPQVKHDIHDIIAAGGFESTVTITRMHVTPDLARMFLMHNKSNRTLSEPHVQKFVNLLKEDHWESDNGATIKFNKAGNLIDGQHRLQAIIISGIAADIDVATGLSEKAQATIDVGRSRTIGDQLAIEGEKYANQVAATVRWIHILATGQMTYVMSTPEVQDFLKKFPEVRDSVYLIRSKNAKGATPTLLAALHFIFSRAMGYPEKADAYASVFITGEPNYKGDPVFRAREAFRDAKEKGQTLDNKRQIANLSHAWNLFLKDQAIRFLRLPSAVKIEGFDAAVLGIKPRTKISTKTVKLDGVKLLERA